MNFLCSMPLMDRDWCFGTLRSYIRPGSRVLLVALAFDDAAVFDEDSWQAMYGRPGGRYYAQNVEQFFRFGVKEDDIDWVRYFSDTPEQARRKIQRADTLCFAGGLPDRMYERILEMDLLEPIRRHKGFIAGYSAGAMVQLGEYHITPDEDYPVYKYAEGCGLVGGFDVEVHYEGSAVQQAGIERAIAEKGLPVYAFADDGGLLVDGSRVTPLGDVRVFPPR